MKFYPHWAKAAETFDIRGEAWKLERYGWSNESREAALAKAKELLRKMADNLHGGNLPWNYLYSDRPVREEILEELPGEDGHAAVITRNAYGTLVLNTAKVLFADIDNPNQKSPSSVIALGRLFGGLFSKKAAQPEPIESTVARVEQFFNDSLDLGARLYRTAAGYRCLVTSHVFDPLSQETNKLLTALGTDPLYIKLCNVQECFRARLSPKPWRCGMGNPPHRFPWDDAEKEAAMRVWEAEYNAIAEPYGICELIGSHGNRQIHPQVAALLKLHDGLTCKAGAQLA